MGRDAGFTVIDLRDSNGAWLTFSKSWLERGRGEAPPDFPLYIWSGALSLIAGEFDCIQQNLASTQPGELGLDLSALLRSGFSDDEIQRLRRLRREGSPERLSRSWRLVRQRVTTGPWARPDSPGVPLPKYNTDNEQ